MSKSWDVKINAGALVKSKAGAAQGLLLAAEHILQVSRTMVPIEEGTLEKSGATSVDAATLTAAVSYDTVYAARQHEEMDWAHDDGRSAKYLENAFNSERATVAKIIADEIKL